MKAIAGICVLVLFSGCKPKPVSDSAVGPLVGAGAVSSTRAADVIPLDPATLGTVTGVVRFGGKAPAPVRIDTTMDPACGLGGDVFSEQYEVSGGKLANVFVYVKNGPAAAMTRGGSGTQPVVMDQKGCRYTPHVIGVVKGGTVRFTNSDPTMHNIHDQATADADQVDVSQGPHGAPVDKVFSTAEIMIPVRCNNHPWMNAFVNVAPTPFFAVSDVGGRFRIAGLPAGSYTLGAVHEKMGEQTLQVVVAAKGTTVSDLTFAK